MPSEPFVHLRVRSGYSLLTGALRPDELVKLAAADGQPAVAMTDHANMFGALEFAQVAAKTGVQPIHGCLLPLLIDDGQPRRSLPDDDLPQILLLAQNETGYGHLLALQTAAYLSEGREQVAVTLDDLAAHSDGVLALSGMLDGPLARPLQRGQDEQAEVILGALKAIFAERLYIEIQRHGLDGQAALEEAMIALAFAHDLPLVATNDVRFADDSMFAPHDALMCIAESTIVTQDERTRVSPEHRFKSVEDMRALFADLPEAIANTAVIARRCAYLSPARDPILPPFDTAGGRNEAQELRAQAEEGLEERLEH
ncbi:MAG: PHP domain-containing protein, partial [Geminicoccaceae bacterium]